jgi:ornithine--oxo-acid transaminase/putrescine aminotransferase
MPEYSERSAMGLLACHRLYKAGFLVNVCGHDWSVLRLQPPLDTGSERLAAFVHACRDAVEYLCELR